MSEAKKKVVMIGLDSSHAVEYTRRMQAPDYDAELRVKKLVTTSCLRFPSAFQSEPNQDKRQEILEGWGVKVTRDFDEAVADCDAIFMPVNDPALHLEWFERCVQLDKPIFVDKPLADSLASSRRIVALAAENKVPLFSSSSLRYDIDFNEALAAAPKPEVGMFWGPLGRPPTGSGVIWYGVHVFEMVCTAMGTGAMAVRASYDPTGLLITVTYNDGRRAVAELTSDQYRFGGMLRERGKKAVTFDVTRSRIGYYDRTLREVEKFYFSGQTPVPVSETLEVMGLLCATDRSALTGNSEPVFK